MGLSSSSIYRGHGIFGDEDAPTRLHPAMRAQLLDPKSEIWKPNNVYLRLFHRDLDLLIAELTLQAADGNLSPTERRQAKTHLTQLRQRIACYFRTAGRLPGRSAGRPPKLTLGEREAMLDEHDRLRDLIRSMTNTEAPSGPELDRLFRTSEFQVVLFGEFPCKAPVSERAWKQVLRTTAGLALSVRCLHYLAFQYDVSVHTIQAAIWPRNMRHVRPQEV